MSPIHSMGDEMAGASRNDTFVLIRIDRIFRRQLRPRMTLPEAERCNISLPMFGWILSGKSAGPQRSLRLFLTLLLCVQALVTAAHIHSSHYYVADAARSEVIQRSPGDSPSSGDPADCAICHLHSLMDDALLPSGIALVASAILALWAARACGLSPNSCARTRGWLSRAPPALR